MDMAKGEMRDFYFQWGRSCLEERASDGSVVQASDRTSNNYQKTGDLITAYRNNFNRTTICK